MRELGERVGGVYVAERTAPGTGSLKLTNASLPLRYTPRRRRDPACMALGMIAPPLFEPSLWPETLWVPQESGTQKCGHLPQRVTLKL